MYLNRHFPRYINVQAAQENMPNIIKHQENANQDHNMRYHFASTRMVVIKKTDNKKL